MDQPQKKENNCRRSRFDVTQIHHDPTTVEPSGTVEVESVEDQSTPVPMPACGRTRSDRENVKQVQLGLGTSRARC